MKTTLIFFAVLLSSCVPALQRGDAKITRTPGFLDFGIETGYEVIFPTVPLSRAGTTTFNFVHLPAGSYEYSYKVTGGSRLADAEFHRGDHTLAEVYRPNAVVAVSALSSDGKVLFQEDVRIGNLDWDRNGGSALIPSDSPTVSPATDFQLSVTVVTPSTNLRERFQIIGFARRR